jgi:integrase
MATKLTTIAVENAKAKKRAGALVRTEIADRGAPGLFLVIQPSGAKSWAYRYRIAGRSRKLTLGSMGLTLAEARLAAAQARRELELGRDPANDKQAAKAAARVQAAESIERAVESFLELHARRKTRPASLRLTESIFRRFVVPAWGDRNVRDIRRKDVIALVENVATDTPVLANRVLSALSKFFGWLAARDMVDASPCKGVEPPGTETARDRVLDDDELRALWMACSRPDAGPAEAVIRMLILTGTRRTEAAAIAYSEIDIDKRVWTIPAARSKNRRAHTVPLTAQAWDIIQAQPKIGAYVFSATGKRPIRNLDRLKVRLDRELLELGFTKPWVIHDIRRSVASGLQALGVRIEVIEATLGHMSGTFRGIVGTYQKHDYAAERRAALTKWADHIERLAEGEKPPDLALPEETMVS